MDEIDLKARPAPTVQRPLLGLTLLVVEDSRFASEAVRLLALRSGARLRRADTLIAAHRHLGTYRPDVVIVDLGLPDGSGLDLIEELATARTRPFVILATSGQAGTEVSDMAGTRGADGFLSKPVESLAAFQEAVLAHMPADLRPPPRRALSGEQVQPDGLALTEDLDYADKALDEGRPPSYVAAFLEGLARTGHDAVLLAEAQALSGQTSDDIRPRLRSLISDRRAKRRRAI